LEAVGEEEAKGAEGEEEGEGGVKVNDGLLLFLRVNPAATWVKDCRLSILRKVISLLKYYSKSVFWTKKP
jgi:hypothetical protein